MASGGATSLIILGTTGTMLDGLGAITTFAASPLCAVRIPPLICVKSDASYVLAGGYGGLGRSLARWMASGGATSLIILSRSEKASPDNRWRLETSATSQTSE
jgi:hypothetical protein